ncbi:dead-box atp-dependent rna helicase 21-like [Stylonychia lemnae]|uniref:RNA helicase n=1 Tax=Stylonychia lemnae TaxID=5949 RepID=A0A078AEH3_STYLE|nr:dead-box atp-dependent rna helicase 21-like [Stylonychia lemnae]|eukprot:CDW80241.1 dead-box atp-dependent rna helicase 21-like [Stylonychia lemnae]
MSSSISTENKANGSETPKVFLPPKINQIQPQFLSKKQREELKKKQEDEDKHQEEEKRDDRDRNRDRDYRDRKDDRDRDHRGDGDKQRRDDERNVKVDQRRVDEEKNSAKDKVEKDKKLFIDEREIEMIKGKYLGTIKEKKRVIKPSDKFKQVFHFEWDASEDTSKDINPLYSQRHDPKLLFGKGFVGGVDHDFQRKKYGNGDDKKLEKDQRVSLEETMNKPLLEMTERDWKIFKEDQDIMTKGGRIPHPIRNWDEIEDLDPFLRDNIAICGYKRPMPIQMQGIAIGMNCRDMIGLAPTGSGKSAAFLIPLINFMLKLPPIRDELVQDGPYAIIMAPSRELAIQIETEFRKLANETPLRSQIVVGGKSAEEQGSSISRGVEIIIGTPGRIEDLVKRRYLVLNQCYYVILDEADKMIDLDLEESVNFILESIPSNLQKADKEKDVAYQEQQILRGEKFFKTFVMFSATMLPQIEKLARKYLRSPAFITIGEPGGGKKDIEQRIEFVSESQKRSRLQQLLDKFRQPPIIIFVNQRSDTEHLSTFLTKVGYSVNALHGSKTQQQREAALNSLKSGSIDILVCTNVAARGLDVDNVAHVINYHAPQNIIDYIHRIGRTGRAGRKGMATTFLTNADESIFYDLKKFLQDNDQPVPNELANHNAAKFKGGQENIGGNVGAPSKNNVVPTSTQQNKLL